LVRPKADGLPAGLDGALQLGATAAVAGVVAKARVGANGQAAAGFSDQVQAGQDRRLQLQGFNSARGAGAGGSGLRVPFASLSPDPLPVP
jgi:hypothetical protein